MENLKSKNISIKKNNPLSCGLFFLCESISQGKEFNCSATFLGLYRKDFALSGQPADVWGTERNVY